MTKRLLHLLVIVAAVVPAAVFSGCTSGVEAPNTFVNTGWVDDPPASPRTDPPPQAANPATTTIPTATATDNPIQNQGQGGLGSSSSSSSSSTTKDAG